MNKFKHDCGFGWTTLGVAALVVALFGGMAGPAQAQQRGRCASVALDWPVRLPDGSVHAADSLSLCLNDYWTPVSGLHELKVDGHAVGRFMSQVGYSEGSAGRSPIVVFEREADGTHRLVGYAWPAGGQMRTFALGETPRIRSGADHRLHAALIQGGQELVVVALNQALTQAR